MNKFAKGLLAAIFVASSVLATTGLAHAWGEAEYTANGKPQFNTYNNVTNIGDEHDFLRVGLPGTGSANFSNSQELCADGNAKLTVYVHNGAPETFNGENNTGTGVAKNTKLAINLGDSKALSAAVSASNAATVTDGASITCDGKAVQLEYVAGSATVVSAKRTSKALNDAVVSGGTLVGTYADDGVVPGCWDSRVYVSLLVRVKKDVPPTPKPPVTPPTPESPATPPATPKAPVSLPNTGPGDVVAIFGATSVAGAAAHNVYVRRRKLNV